MNKAKTSVALLAISAILSAPLFAEEAAKAAAPTTTVKGEVLDMVCFMDHGGKGAKHKDCAQKCIDGGAPAGLLLSDGKVLLLLEDHKNPDALKAVRAKAAEEVEVKGKLVSRGGVKGIIVE